MNKTHHTGINKQKLYTNTIRWFVKPCKMCYFTIGYLLYYFVYALGCFIHPNRIRKFKETESSLQKAQDHVLSGDFEAQGCSQHQGRKRLDFDTWQLREPGGSWVGEPEVMDPPMFVMLSCFLPFPFFLGSSESFWSHIIYS